MKGENHEDEGFTKYWNKKKKKRKNQKSKIFKKLYLMLLQPIKS